MAVAYVAHTIDSSSAARNGFTFEHTVAAGNDRYLIVVLHMHEAEWASGVTYDGNSMTWLRSYGGRGMNIVVYGKALGSSGSPTTADVVVTSGTGDWNPSVGIACDFSGVHQTDPYGGEGAWSFQSANSRYMYVTTETANSMVFMTPMMGGDDCHPSAPDYGETERWDANTGGGDNDLADFTFWGGGRNVTTAQQYTIGISWSANAPGIGIGFEIKQAGGVVHEGAATATGTGSAAGSAVLTIVGTATATGAGTAAGAAGLTTPGAGTATGVGTATASATVTAEVEAAATATGVGTATAAADLTKATLGAATATGVGTATATAGLTLPAAATATGVGTATAAGSVTADIEGAAIATGAGTATGAAVLTIVGAGTAAGVGTAAGAAGLMLPCVATATGVGTATASGSVTADVEGAATATGLGTATATAGLMLPGVADATGIGTATAAAILTLLAAADATGVGSATAAGTTGEIAYWGEPCDTYTGGPRRGTEGF